MCEICRLPEEITIGARDQGTGVMLVLERHVGTIMRSATALIDVELAIWFAAHRGQTISKQTFVQVINAAMRKTLRDIADTSERVERERDGPSA